MLGDADSGATNKEGCDLEGPPRLERGCLKGISSTKKQEIHRKEDHLRVFTHRAVIPKSSAPAVGDRLLVRSERGVMPVVIALTCVMKRERTEIQQKEHGQDKIIEL
jgi:hypothetical protein